MSLALVTTAHPGSLLYLREFAETLGGQLGACPLVVAVDGVPIEAVREALGRLPATLVPAGGSFGAVRQAAWAAVPPEVERVLTLDADDLPAPDLLDRAARTREITAFALSLADEEGRDLRVRFPAEPRSEPGDALPWCNHFGLGNTVWPREALLSMGAVPAEVRAVDWWLATALWLRGAVFHFDPTPALRYRQHGSAFGDARLPWDELRLGAAVRLVLGHHSAVAGLPGLPERVQALARGRRRAHAFASAIEEPAVLREVLCGLASLPSPLPWWGCVAHPALEEAWTR